MSAPISPAAELRAAAALLRETMSPVVAVPIAALLDEVANTVRSQTSMAEGTGSLSAKQRRALAVARAVAKAATP